MADKLNDRATQFPRQRWAFWLVVVVLAVYALEAHARARKYSAPADLGDQGAYLGYARHLHESNYTVTEDRNRMPVYPFLLSLIYRPGMSETEFLVSAQKFTVNLSILLLALLFLIFRRFFSALPAVALLAATAFGVLLYRVGKAQTEPLFYFISFCAFVLLLRMFQRPRWWLALLAGATTAVAHLTKASILPALVIWAAVFGAQVVWNWRITSWRRVGLLALVLVSFLAVVFPYIQTSKRIYGAYFYNVNSTFVMWCDSSDESYQFLSTHGDKDQWRALPPDQLPSLQKYWREHSLSQMLRRLGKGSLSVATQNARAIGYYKYVVALLIAALVLMVKQWREARELLARNPFAAIFCLFFFVAYFLLYAWYDQIVSDVRFALSIFLPLIFAASLLALRLGRDRTASLAGRQFSFERFFGGSLLALSMIDVLYVASDLLR